MTHETPTSATPRPELSAPPTDKRPMIVAVIIMVVFLIAFIAFGVFLFKNPATTAVLRDMFIILLALQTILVVFITMVLILTIVYLVMKVNDLVQLVNRETEPLLKKANNTAEIAMDTARTVQSRVTVVSDEAVKPVVNTLSTVSAVKAVFKTLFGR